MDIKITKKEKIFEQHNDKVSNYCYLIHGRIINDNGTRYRKFKFVIHFDGYDLYDECVETKEDFMNFLDSLIDGFTSSIISYDDCGDFYKLCSESIDNYNQKFAA